MATDNGHLVIAFISLRKFLQNYAFCDVTKFRNAGLPMVRSQMNQIAFSRIKEIVGKDLDHFFSTSSSPHFFDKTDFKQCLF